MALLVLGACSQPVNNHVIAQNDEFTVNGDSVIVGDDVVWAASPLELSGVYDVERAQQLLRSMAGSDTLPYRLTAGAAATMTPPEGSPVYQSGQLLIDALWNLSLGDVAANYSQLGGFNSHNDHNSLYGAIYLSLAMLDPMRAMTTLRTAVDDGLVMQHEGTWPLCDDRMAWPVAAWEVYCVTGDRQWLAEAYEVTLNTIDEELVVQLDAGTGLMHGGQLARYAAGNFYPAWANAIDLTGIETLINNVMAVRAMEVAGEMADELGEEAPYATIVGRLREAVNNALWDEARGRYSAYRMGRFAPMRVPLTDNMAQALAVLWDLADDGRSTTLIEDTPVGHRGVTSTYPSTTLEPYLEQPSWALTQACWNIACANVGNEHALRLGLAALYRALAIYQPNHLSIEGAPVNSLASAAAGVAMVLRVFAGMRLTPDGIEFDPTVPACLPGNKTILNFVYRDATIDITISGTGSDIDAMTLDGQAVEGGFIPGDLQGHHNLLIQLKPGKGRAHKVTLATAVALPPTPDVQWNVDLGNISQWSTGLGYKLLINGARSYSLSDSTFKLPPLPPLAEVSVISANRRGYSLPSRLAISFSNAPVTVTSPDSALMADTLAVKVHTDHAGNYFVSADYSITEGCDIIAIEANGHRQGILYLPATGLTTQQRSAMTTVSLLRGDNRIVLRRYRIGYHASIARLLFIR